jgi:hypothetical protein
MDLALQPGTITLARRARAAFAEGGPAPLVTGPVADLVTVAHELGRAGVPARFHTDVLVHLLGGGALDGATASGEHRTGRVRVVPEGRTARTLLVPDGPAHVLEVDLRHESVVIVERPSVIDPSTCEVTFGPAAVRRRHTIDTTVPLAVAAVVLAADAVGAAAAALAAALDHVGSREQFGAPLGALQAVQHRAADMAIDVRLAGDAVLDAAGVADRGEPAEAVVLAAAHAKVGVDRCRRVTASAHQLAGGQGILAAAPFHRWHRRVMVAGVLLGDARHHRSIIGRAAIAGARRFA